MLSEKPWNREVLLLLLAGLLLSWCLGTILGILLERFLPVEAVAQKSFYHFVISTITFHGAILLLVTQFLRLNGTNWREFLGLGAPRLRQALLFAAVVAILALPVVWILNDWSDKLLTFLLRSKPEIQPTIKVLESTVGVGQRICFGMAAILLAPVAEESLFRGVLYPFVKQRGYRALAIFGTSLLFAAFHASLVTVLPLTFFAIVLIFVYERTDKLMAPIVTHALFNSLNFLAIIYGAELDHFLRPILHR